MRTNTCADCGSVFVVANAMGMLPQRCDPCRAERKKTVDSAKARKWRRENPERSREHWNKHNRARLADPEYVRFRAERTMLLKYGLTQADFDALLASQGGVCAICKGDRNGPGARFHVDHCHNSDKVRGLLCGRCNTAIGLLQDNPEIADAAAAYLRR